MNFRRYRIRVIVLLLLGTVVLTIVLLSSHSSNIKKSRLRKRRLKWFTYDEYDDSPVLEYFDIETKLIPHVPTIPDNSYDIQNEDLDDDKSIMLNFPWANESHDFTAESQQFLNLIINTLNTENTQLCPKNYSSSKWFCCLTDDILYDGIVYTFDVEQENNIEFEIGLSRIAELQSVHSYNPNLKEPMEITEEVDADQNVVEYHKIALDTESNEKQNRRWRRKTFSEIRTSFEHDRVSLVRLNMNSSEWKIMKQLLDTGELKRINQLIVKIHLHWAGFGISGTPEEVVHQWYNIIRSIIESGMTLTSTKNDEEPKIFMSQPDLFHSSCCYYLTFSRL